MAHATVIQPVRPVTAQEKDVQSVVIRVSVLTAMKRDNIPLVAAQENASTATVKENGLVKLVAAKDVRFVEETE